jgi:hypothetical protein
MRSSIVTDISDLTPDRLELNGIFSSIRNEHRQAVAERPKCDDRPAGGLLIRIVLTALVFIGGRGAGIAIAAASGGSSSSGAAW